MTSSDSNSLLEYFPSLSSLLDIKDVIGEGTFSTVYLGITKISDQKKKKFALKEIVPTSHPNRVVNEIKCLKLLGGRHNVMGVHACLRESDHILLVMPYFRHDNFHDYYNNLSLTELQDYIRNLLIALKWIHHKKIIHRDVKPSNFLYNRSLKRYSLIDFGLAQQEGKSWNFSKMKFASKLSSNENKVKASCSRKETSNIKDSTSATRPALCSKTNLNTSKDSLRTSRKINKLFENRKRFPLPRQSYKVCSCLGKPTVCPVCTQKPMELSPRGGTPGFRPPEVLLQYPKQTIAVDMWAAGVILLTLLSGRYPIFRSPDDMTGLAEIASVLGTKDLVDLAAMLGKCFLCSESRPKMNLKVVCESLRHYYCENTDFPKANSSAKQVFPDDIYDLLGGMLEINFKKRMSAADALQHSFFRMTF